MDSSVTDHSCPGDAKPESCPQPRQQQHDLEKLQQAHDVLMHQIEEQRTFIEKLHIQLDRALEENEEVRRLVSEKEKDLETLERALNEKDSEIEKLKQHEVQFNKLKQLAVKLKKELAEAKEELDRKSVSSSSPETNKESTKQLAAEVDKLTNLYQNSVRNFQNLQSEFDKLQDDFDQQNDVKKKCEQDLNQTINELSKVKIEAAEAKHQNENLSKKVAALEDEAETSFTKRKDLESKIIILQNELKEEKKKIVNQTALEKSSSDLRKQLELKISEISEMSELLVKNKDVHDENIKLKATIIDLESRLKQTLAELEESKENSWNLSRKLESHNSTSEQERVRFVELMNANKKLQDDYDSLRDTSTRRRMELESKLKDCQRRIKELEEDSDARQTEFSAYKAKVLHVLNERKSDQHELLDLTAKNQDMEEKIETYQRKIDSLVEELENEKSRSSDFELDISRLKREVEILKTESASQIEEYQREVTSLKSTMKDLQIQLACAKREILEKANFVDPLDFEDVKKQLQESQSNRSSLEQQLQELQSMSRKDLKSKSSEIQNSYSSNSGTLVPSTAPKSVDDVESIGTESVSSNHKRLSVSSSSDIASGTTNNILDELMNLRFDESEEEHAIGGVGGDSPGRLESLKQLLEESENGNALLAEQNKVLKEEIRRLERAMSRVEVAQNLEYLKNVLVKFISLESGSSEKQQLVSVLKTILKLGEDEVAVLAESANKSTANADPAQGASPWIKTIWG